MLIIAVNKFCKTINVQFYEGNSVDGQYLFTICDGKASNFEAMEGRMVVDAEAYWRLRKDLLATQKILTELLNRMRFIHDEKSIADMDYPIHEVVSR
ncbi:hypothetical protein KKI95_16195 [Xenorhabdus bovienii]|uniref:Uncharacterized protein n=1 Tax=Xenorhabdus bovienii str. Intermedium TaxID=1379677 RepID=A0A077QLT8_XENBV|nr:hypothetical protein [Xenorhabdus bovienii]MDE9437429.1 hypothetical protein [Xenorhabdus bovienii]CDH33296.1 hypothetical protein XBI1_2560003 [Xenorhabdus bovienii str. Intermedium]